MRCGMCKIRRQHIHRTVTVATEIRDTEPTLRIIKLLVESENIREGKGKSVPPTFKETTTFVAVPS